MTTHRSDRPRRPASLPILSLAAALAVAWPSPRPAVARPIAAPSPQDAPARVAPPPDPARIDAMLSAEPTVLEGLGVAIRVPVEAVVEHQGSGQASMLVAIERDVIPLWSMRLQAMASTLDEPTPRAQIEHLIASRRQQGSAIEVVASEPFAAGERDGWFCWIVQSVELVDRMVFGWFCLPIGARDYLVLSAQVAFDGFPAARPMIEAAARTIRATDAADLVAERRAGLERGRLVLQTITPERLRALVGFDQWYRVYFPAGAAAPAGQAGGPTIRADDQELGALRLRVEEGPLGAVNPQRAPSQYAPDERQNGFIVRVQTRFGDAETGAVLDTEAIYWMAFDQGEESWSLRATERLGARTRSEAVTGVRSRSSASDPAGTLIIVSTGRGTRPRQVLERAVPEVYLSQALRWVLGMLLPRGDQSIDLLTYCAEASAEEIIIALREDRWSPLRGMTPRWEHRTTPRRGGQSTRSLHAADGSLQRREHADGSVMEPIDLDRLRDLWRRAGLFQSGRPSDRQPEGSRDRPPDRRSSDR
ncbi:MAG: hypothetical protein KF817_10970 [Phycisphaeraceae bacterium]|nr:hypothetical protein [Phycisphaeraceae bacterium]